MNIQIVNSETGEVVVTKQGLKLEAVIPGHKTLAWHKPIRRHRRKVLLKELVGLLTELRDETRRV